MDIDKMFKLPALPSGGGNKRKMGNLPDPETLKRYKPSEPQSASETMPPPLGGLNGKGKGRAVTVEDEDIEAEYSRANP